MRVLLRGWWLHCVCHTTLGAVAILLPTRPLSAPAKVRVRGLPVFSIYIGYIVSVVHKLVLLCSVYIKNGSALALTLQIIRLSLSHSRNKFSPSCPSLSLINLLPLDLRYTKHHQIHTIYLGAVTLYFIYTYTSPNPSTHAYENTCLYIYFIYTSLRKGRFVARALASIQKKIKKRKNI